MDFETVIGLEVHVQLATESKIFCASPAHYGAGPNEHIDPLTFGLPGTLPVVNRRVVESAIQLGLATNCEIRRYNRFARKHYFYPDLPKGYQISQFEEPICERGNVKVVLGETIRTIGITRIHMEEDAGKSIHEAAEGCSLVDLNRAGVPLLEVVSEPDIRSASEASAYLKALRQIVRYLGIGDGNMEEGSLRCDANISLRPVGEMKFGTRTEIKNLNSFRFVERALEYEIARQLSLLKAGEKVVQETRLFDSESGVTRSMRSKEESADYRYFPDPDLPPLVIEESWIQSLKSSLPVLPERCRQSLVDDFELSTYDASLLTTEKSYYDFFTAVQDVCGNPKSAANWIGTELFGRLNQNDIDFEESPISAEHLGGLIRLIDDGTISGKMAKTVFDEMFSTGDDPKVIVEREGLQQITDTDEIRRHVLKVFEENPDQREQFIGGKTKLLGFFVGQVMKATSGSANAAVINQVISEEAERLKKEG
jgi:aspartyl-tRNA(Asn)/glutamyl-tRNA(Gln) amidotransferase subunit B